MLPELIQTKLFAPPPRAHLVARPRLLARLNAGLQPGCRLILVCGPAGFGKTTLVSAWIDGLHNAPSPLSNPQFSWLSLEDDDNHLPRFFSYLVAGIQAHFPEIGRNALDLLGLPRPLQVEELVSSLANELAGVTRPFVLALDDLHLADAPQVQNLLSRLVEALPPQVHLLIMSRQDPSLPLSRLRARGQMVEVRLDDLRFTPAEASEFLSGVMGVSLSAEDVAALEEKTEGWIAGLQLAALSMQGRPDAHAFIRAFSGNNRFILDYLAEEVLNRQPPAIQQFLLQTSVFDQMCAELCAYVIERRESRVEAGEQVQHPTPDSPLSTLHSPISILDHLDRTNLFLVPLDGERRWYRYHHLFGELLRARLKQSDPELIPALQIRAAHWFEENGLSAAAVRYALAAKDFTLAAGLIEKHSRERWAQADLDFLAQIHQIPFEILRNRTELSLQRAWMLVIQGQIELADRYVGVVEDRFLPYLNEGRLRELDPAQLGMLGFALGVRAYINELTHKPTDIRKWMPVILGYVPESFTAYRNTMEVLIAILLAREGDFAAASGLYLSAAERDLKAGTTNAVCVAISGLASARIVEGHLREAAELCSYYQAKIDAIGAWRFYLTGDLKTFLADVRREWNELDEAGRLAAEAVRENEPWQIPQPLAQSHLVQGRISLAQSDLAGAEAALRSAEQALQRTQIPAGPLTPADDLRVRLWLAGADLSQAEHWASQCQQAVGDDFSFRFEAGRINLGRVWAALGRLDEATALLVRLAQDAEAGGRRGRLVHILALLANVYHRQKNSALALTTLEKALRLAEPEGYVRVFIDEGEPMQTLLLKYRRRLEKQPVQEAYSLFAYLDRLLRSFSPAEAAAATGGPPSAAHRAPTAGPGGLVEPLTGRELEILALMASGLTNQEIARKLTVSIHTVKVHVSNIFQKLGAANRTGAVSRAQELHLI